MRSCSSAHHYHYIGAYSSLEMANGDTIVSIGIALAVLVCIGTGSISIRPDSCAIDEGV